MFRTGRTPFDGKLIITYLLSLLGVGSVMFIVGVVLLLFGVDFSVVDLLFNWMKPIAIVVALVIFFVTTVKKIIKDNRMI